MLDPTLLHDKDFYVKALKLKECPIGRSLVTYILGAKSERMDKINKLGAALAVSIDHIYKESRFQLMYKRPFSLLRKYKKVPSTIEWLNKILHAKYVVTDSFHGMVFCILFHKQFVVIDNIEGGSERFLCLLEKLNLRDRLCSWQDANEVLVSKLKNVIDYVRVDERIKFLKENSMIFLKSNL